MIIPTVIIRNISQTDFVISLIFAYQHYYEESAGCQICQIVEVHTSIQLIFL